MSSSGIKPLNNCSLACARRSFSSSFTSRPAAPSLTRRVGICFARCLLLVGELLQNTLRYLLCQKPRASWHEMDVSWRCLVFGLLGQNVAVEVVDRDVAGIHDLLRHGIVFHRISLNTPRLICRNRRRRGPDQLCIGLLQSGDDLL